MFRRFFRRMLAVTLGLALGWICAGMLPTLQTSYAADGAEGPSTDVAEYESEVADGPDTDLHPDQGDGHGPQADSHQEAGGHHGDGTLDGGQQAASKLIPLPADGQWYSKVLVVAGGLFGLAVMLGYPAMKLFGSQDQQEAAAGGDGH